jgi:hypothetical protein
MTVSFSRAAGPEFARFIQEKFKVPVTSISPSNIDFSLLVAFGSCRFRLEHL